VNTDYRRKAETSRRVSEVGTVKKPLHGRRRSRKEAGASSISIIYHKPAQVVIIGPQASVLTALIHQ
jgi:hypothetical protein